MDNLWIIYGSGWWYTYPSEKYEFVNWDDYSQYMEFQELELRILKRYGDISLIYTDLKH